MQSPLLQLIIVQFKSFIREPEVIFWSLLFPILLAWGLGMAFNKDNESVITIVQVRNEQYPDSALRRFIVGAKEVRNINSPDEKALEHDVTIQGLGITHYKMINGTWEQAYVLLKRGVVNLVIEETAQGLEYHFDPKSGEAKSSYLQFSGILKGKQEEFSHALIKPLSQKGTRYIDFLVPGLIAMGLMMSTMWGISYSLIEKRSKKLLRRLVATPMHKSSFMISQFAARFVLCTLEALVLYTFARYFFGMTIEGNISALIALFCAGFFAFCGIALLLASRTSNTFVGNGIINLVVMPMMILSGIYFSYHNFPDVIIPYIQALPLTMIADGIRSVFLEGAGWTELFKPIIILSIIGLVTFISGLKVFKWY